MVPQPGKWRPRRRVTRDSHTDNPAHPPRRSPFPLAFPRTSTPEIFARDCTVYTLARGLRHRVATLGWQRCAQTDLSKQRIPTNSTFSQPNCKTSTRRRFDLRRSADDGFLCRDLHVSQTWRIGMVATLPESPLNSVADASLLTGAVSVEPLSVTLARGAALTGVSYHTLWRMVKDKTLPCARIRGRLVVPLAALKSLLPEAK